MYGDHSGKNQGKAILPVIDEYLLKSKLGYFFSDNASTNDTCIAELIDLIRPNLRLSFSNQRRRGIIWSLNGETPKGKFRLKNIERFSKLCGADSARKMLYYILMIRRIERHLRVYHAISSMNS